MRVTVISTFATDKLIKNSGVTFRKGGPALFITRTLDELNIPYDLFCSDNAIVEIDMRGNNEKGRIIRVTPIKRVSEIRKGLVLISTLLKEFELKAIGEFPCLDIQGYVRDGTGFGKKKKFDSEELEKFEVVKATGEEIQYIPKSRVNSIKVLVVTNGCEGFDVITQGEKYSFRTNRIECDDTIGAGDTFFTAFCVKYYQTKNIFWSAEFAKRVTNEFLENKKALKKEGANKCDGVLKVRGGKNNEIVR